MARAAEEVGFDSIWLGDHLLYRDDGRPERGPWDVWTLLAALAAATERVVLGPLVACLGFHPPGLDRSHDGRHRRDQRRALRARRRVGLERGGVPRLRAAVRPPRVALHRELRDHPPAARGRARHEPGHASGRPTTPCCFHRRHAATPIMVGSSRPAAARGDAAPRRQLEHLVGLVRQHRRGLRRRQRRDQPRRPSARGRDPAEVERSACVAGRASTPAARRAAARRRGPAAHGQPRSRSRGALHELAEAGADEAILVLDPITEATRAAVRRRARGTRRLSGYLPMPAVRPRTKKRWPER